MGLVSWALLELGPFRDYVGARGSGDGQRAVDAINWATAEIETALGRQLISRGAMTELHSLEDRWPKLWLNEWPIISVATVHESDDRTWDDSTKLTAGTDYVVESTRNATLARITSATGKPRAWMTGPIGHPTVQVVYTAGYTLATLRSLVPDLPGLARELAARKYQASGAGEWGVMSRTDSEGTVTRLAPDVLTRELRRSLRGHMRPERPRTGELQG